MAALSAKIGAITQGYPPYQRQNSQLCPLRFQKEIGHVLFIDIVGYSKLLITAGRGLRRPSLLLFAGRHPLVAAVPA
jgi:hypothetical protein